MQHFAYAGTECYLPGLLSLLQSIEVLLQDLSVRWELYLPVEEVEESSDGQGWTVLLQKGPAVYV